MAQPTETERRFEVSERSSALPVPALSRYARLGVKPRGAHSATGDEADETDEASATEHADASATRDVPLDAAAEDLLDVDSLRDPEPIVQAANEEWATDPSPPQPVSDARRTDSPRGTPATAAERSPRGTTATAAERSPRGTTAAAAARSNLPALRDPGAQPTRPEAPRAEERRPFWKRLSMARPAAATPPPVAPIPPDLLRPALERIDHLTRRFEHEQKMLHERLDQFEHNITRLWELEEQMGLEEVRAQLSVIQANQEEIADGVHAIARNVAVAAGLGLAALGGVLLWALL